MKKDRLISYVVTVILSLSAWGAATIVRHDKEIVALDQKEKSNHELLLEVRNDVKLILRGE